MMLLELTTSLAFLASIFSNSDSSSAINSVEIETQAVTQPITLEEHVREYFEETPILAEIARCESTFRHIGTNGRIIRGKVNPDDVGIMQINEYYHLETSESMGYDIYSLDGNMAYATHLYEKYGSKPWSASSKCWKGSIDKLEIAKS